MFDMFGMLQNMQQQIEESKKQLENITVEANAGEGAVKVVATASQKIVSVTLIPELIGAADKEELEDLLLVAVNRALDLARQKAAEEMTKITGNMLPPGFNLPGF
ncbi:nucleoid-associated protein, YbaB/EbfC family [Sphingobacteriales bacterium UPWRP_1]|nr:nucleoid-associated protein, YbaB/EbfC family [Sphingobacteriales bacterium UPWRP_1]